MCDPTPTRVSRTRRGGSHRQPPVRRLRQRVGTIRRHRNTAAHESACMVKAAFRGGFRTADPFTGSLLGRPFWVRLIAAAAGLVVFWLTVAWAVAVP